MPARAAAPRSFTSTRTLLVAAFRPAESPSGAAFPPRPALIHTGNVPARTRSVAAPEEAARAAPDAPRTASAEPGVGHLTAVGRQALPATSSRRRIGLGLSVVPLTDWNFWGAGPRPGAG